MEIDWNMLGDLPKNLWEESVNVVVYILNRCPTKVVKGMLPIEAWTSKKYNLTSQNIWLHCFLIYSFRKEKEAR